MPQHSYTLQFTKTLLDPNGATQLKIFQNKGPSNIIIYTPSYICTNTHKITHNHNIVAWSTYGTSAEFT